MNIIKLPLTESMLPVVSRSASRLINQKAIVDMIYNNDGISKAQLSKQLGISKPAISSNVSQLISMGLVKELGEGEAAKSGGRKPVMLYFNAERGFIGALDLSLREPVCAVCDLQYNIIGLEKIKVPQNALGIERRRHIKQAFCDIFNKNNIPLEKLGAIIISQPGIIKEECDEHYSGERHHAWTEIGLKKYLSETFHAPVSIMNDVNLAAMGEIRFGLKKQCSDLIYVGCGVGLGAGLIINGRLHEGVTYASGEIGAFLLSDGRRAEDAVAIEGLLKRIEQLYQGNNKVRDLTFERAVALVKENDSVVEQAVYEIGCELGRVIYNCCVTLDVPVVILGGEYLNLGSELFRGMNDALENVTFGRPEISPSTLKQQAGIYGGFAVGKDRVIENILRD